MIGEREQPRRTILIVGATGFLGSSLARHFCQLGHQVAALGRGDGRVARLDGVRDQIEWFRVEEDGIDAPFEKLGRVDAVILTVANFGRNGERVQDVFEANTGFPLRVLSAAIRGGCDLLVNADTALQNIENSYSLSKRQFAAWGAHLAQEHPIRFLNLRLEHMYGPGDDERKFPAFVIRSLLRNEASLALTPGQQRRDFVYIADVVRAVEVLISTADDLPPGYQEFSVGSGHSVRIRDFVTMAKSLSGSRTRLRFGALDYRPHEVMNSRAVPDALRVLGWEPEIDLEHGLQLTIDFERQQCGY